jgi:toxin ParE1/3/4
MAKFQLTNKAVTDLNQIWAYTIEKWSEAQANRYYNMLLNCCKDIAENPDLGKNYNEIRTDLFGYSIKRHIIFYRKLKGQPIEITRILHERMDLKSKFSI